MGYIYILKNKVNGKCYVGQTIQSVKKRINNHMYTCRHKNNMPISRAINKYGMENFEVLSFCVDDLLLDEEEVRVIRALDSIEHGYNLETGGNNRKRLSNLTKSRISDGLMGHTVSEETRRKIGASNKGNIWTEERRLLMSKLLTGREVTEETRAKLSTSMKGKATAKGQKRSIETKSKMSIAAKNRKACNWSEKHHSEQSKQKISKSISDWWAKRKAETVPLELPI